MNKIALKGTNLEISKIGMGCGPLGSNEWGNYDQKDTLNAVSKAIDIGVNYFDTADVYGLGRSEELLSQVLGNKIKDVVVSTKVGVNWNISSSEKRAKTFYDSSSNRIKVGLEQSLKRLKLETIPLYFLHWPDPNTPINETIRALQDAVQEGKIQFIGLSNFSIKQIELIIKEIDITAIQHQYSLINRSIDEGLVEFCNLNKINIFSHGALAQGLLSGKYSQETQFDDNDNRLKLPHFKKENIKSYYPLLSSLKSLAKKYEVSESQISLRWVLENKNISTAICGIKSVNQLEDNTNCLNWEILEEDYKFFRKPM